MQQTGTDQSLDYFYSKCKENKLKITPQRIAIFENLAYSDKHPTAEQLHKIIIKHHTNISLDTVNRTLLTFAKIGIVNVVEGFGSPRRYDPNLASHHHAHCLKCGKIIDFDNAEYDELKIPEEIRNKFKITGKRVILNGECESCRNK